MLKAGIACAVIAVLCDIALAVLERLEGQNDSQRWDDLGRVMTITAGAAIGLIIVYFVH